MFCNAIFFKNKKLTDTIVGNCCKYISCFSQFNAKKVEKVHVHVSQHLSNASSLFRSLKADTRPVAECNTKLQLLSYVSWLDKSKYATRIREKQPGHNKSKSYSEFLVSVFK